MTDVVVSDDDNDICEDGTTSFAHDRIPEILPSEVFVQKQTPQDVKPASSMMIMVSKAEFDRLQQELRSRDRKLLAQQNIQFLLREKEVEILALKEKNRSQADALILSEMRYSQLIQLTSKSTNPTETQNRKSVRCVSKTSRSDREETFVPNADIGLSKRTEENSDRDAISDQKMSNKSGNSGKEFSLQTEQETEDGKRSQKEFLRTDEVSAEDSHRHSAAISRSSEPIRKMTESENEHSEHERESSGKEHRSHEEDSSGAAGALTGKARDLPVVGSLRVAGVSKDLVSKLMQQNARLKQVLRQIMSRQGATMEDFLDRQEYISIVEQLRKEVRSLQLRLKDKDNLLVSLRNSDSTGLAEDSLKLHETIQKQKRILAVKDAMVEAFSTRCKELESELKQHRICTRSSNASSLKAGTVLEKHVSEKTNSFAEKSHLRPSLPDSGLTVDGNSDSKQDETTSSTDDSRGTGVVLPSQISPMICGRCDREFGATERDRYLEHCRRCADD